MCKGDFKMVLSFLFSSVPNSSVFEKEIDFEQETSKPTQSLFTKNIEVAEEQKDDAETD